MRGFTLIEISIVLVILGLIVGGVLVGQNLINAARVRATITQVEKYNQAVNTFFGKYGYLPGDIKDPEATRFGFVSRGACPGEGDGDGTIQGIWGAACGDYGTNFGAGETMMFWVDLSAAHMIESGFTAGTPSTLLGSTVTPTTNPGLNAYFPEAKLGQGNYMYAFGSSGVNYYGISAITAIPTGGNLNASVGMTVQQAYAIDKKVDDGYPQSGRMTARYINSVSGAIAAVWAGTAVTNSPPYTTATPASASTCFDNGNAAGATQQYSVAQNDGAGVNCALMMQLQ